jgi:hypothetical protein
MASGEITTRTISVTMTTAPTACAVPTHAPELAVAGSFLDALAAGDYPRMASALAPSARLHALVPSGLREWSGAVEICAAFANWFGDADQLQLLDIDAGAVGPRLHLHWRVRMRAARLGPGWFVVEQHAYAETDSARAISELRLLCSGYCPELS